MSHIKNKIEWCLKKAEFLKYILPVIIWMIFIFYISSLSSPPSPGEGIKFFNEIFHFSEYLILSFLFLRMFNSYNFKHSFLLAIIFSIIYALTDEIHQLFIPYRAFEIKDLIIDSFGASVILISLFFKK